MNPFWISECIKADKAFIYDQLKKFCSERDIKLLTVPSGQHSKNAIESKHGIVRSIFLKLVYASPNKQNEVLAVRAMSISNDLYGNDVMSSFEQAKGFTKPINGN